MGLVNEFISRYRKEFDFYDQAARLVRENLERSLDETGIHAIVSSRAKAVPKLLAKCHQREQDKQYASVNDIYDDIVDLAGVRVALYFPGERNEVDKLVRELFVLLEPPKIFEGSRNPPYSKRFSGYWATHYRVHIRENLVTEAQKRYAVARVEVQVASVLMHAWAEIEHDLVYKPLEGRLSTDEYAVLDELNGLVMAGELALERLQRAGDERVAAGGRQFANHYDLASHLLSRMPTSARGPHGDAALGRVDQLYALLRLLNLATPDGLSPYLDALSTDTERRPVAEQIIDRLLAEDASRYEAYETIRASEHGGKTRPMEELAPTAELHQAIGLFLERWTELERVLRNYAPQPQRVVMPSTARLQGLGIFEEQSEIAEFERIRRLRNQLVHGIDRPDPADLREAADIVERFASRLQGPSKGGPTG